MFAEESKQVKAVARKARVEFRDAVGKVVAEGCWVHKQTPPPGRPHAQPATAAGSTAASSGFTGRARRLHSPG